MSNETERERTGPTDEVGSDTQNVMPAGEHVEELDHQQRRDGRPRP